MDIGGEPKRDWLLGRIPPTPQPTERTWGLGIGPLGSLDRLVGHTDTLASSGRSLLVLGGRRESNLGVSSPSCLEMIYPEFFADGSASPQGAFACGQP